MRRVIVDQIEALAELNRIVARHGRGLDTIDPTARRVEPVAVAAGPRRVGREEALSSNGSGRPEPAPRARSDISRADISRSSDIGRADITGMSAPAPAAAPTRRAEAATTL